MDGSRFLGKSRSKLSIGSPARTSETKPIAASRLRKDGSSVTWRLGCQIRKSRHWRETPPPRCIRSRAAFTRSSACTHARRLWVLTLRSPGGESRTITPDSRHPHEQNGRKIADYGLSCASARYRRGLLAGRNARLPDLRRSLLRVRQSARLYRAQQGQLHLGFHFFEWGHRVLSSLDVADVTVGLPAIRTQAGSDPPHKPLVSPCQHGSSFPAARYYNRQGLAERYRCGPFRAASAAH